MRQVELPFEERAFLASCFDDVLSHSAAPSVIAVDIPIGFPERITGAGRECDCSVRKLLGKRASSVFAPPARAVLAVRIIAVLAPQRSPHRTRPRQISKQMFHLFAKIREVDGAITPPHRPAFSSAIPRRLSGR